MFIHWWNVRDGKAEGIRKEKVIAYYIASLTSFQIMKVHSGDGFKM